MKMPNRNVDHMRASRLAQFTFARAGRWALRCVI
jgi:hypothetical protein